MRMTTARAALALLLTGALLASACGDDDDAEGASPTTAVASVTTAAGSEEPAPSTAGDDELCTAERAGGSITVGTGSPFTGFDPTLVSGSGPAGADYMSAFYDTLVRYDATTNEYRPHVAESLEPNGDFTRWTLTLREGVRFGNGDPLTTADVKAHVERLQASRIRASGMAQGIVAMEIVDERTMVFDVGEPWGGFPYVMATEPGWIPNSRLVTERGDGYHLNPTGAGVGPFEFERVAPGEEIVLRAKADYWGGLVCIERLRFINVPGADANHDAFVAGETDVTFISTIEHAREAADQGLVGFELQVGGLNYVMADQGISGRQTPFQDVRVREAMQLAVSYDVLNERVYDGLSEVDSAMMPPSSPLYHGMEGPPYDIERARRLVRETIDEGVWDGSFTYLHAPTPEVTEQAVTLEAMWEAAGMDVTLEATPNATQRVFIERNFEVASSGFNVVQPGSAAWSSLSGLRTGSARQRTGFSDPDMDAAIDQLRAASTDEETIAAFAAMQEVWNRTFPVIIINHGVWAIGVHEHVRGMQYGPDATAYFHTAWVEP